MLLCICFNYARWHQYTFLLFSDNAKYTSPEIRNQMIKLVCSAILDEIIRRVKEAELYAIIADETPDLSRTEQLSILVRYVWNGVVEERLLAVEPMEETTADALFHTINKKLQQCGIEVANMRGQCYDGASNMSGVHTDLQARIKALSPSALYTHCYAHVLNLVIVDTMSNNRIARDLFGTLQNLYVFIATCTKRHAVYLKHQRELNAAVKGTKKREYIRPQEIVRYQMGMSGKQHHGNLPHIRSCNCHSKGH